MKEDQTSNVGTVKSFRYLGWGILALCVLLLPLDWPIHRDSHFHPHFEIERWFGFYGWVALVGTTLLVVAARFGGQIIGRPEDDYDE